MGTDADHVYARIREAIIMTQLRPGAPLVENQLMSAYQVGRTPLRDALHRLNHDELVEIHPRKGTFVTEVTLRDLQQVFEVRVGLEDIVALLATDRCTEEQLIRVKELVVRSGHGNPKSESDVHLDGTMHSLLLEICENLLLSKLYARVSDASLRLLYLTNCGMESVEDQKVFFQGVYDALSLRDRRMLTEILRTHVGQFRDRVQQSIFGELGDLASHSNAAVNLRG